MKNKKQKVLVGLSGGVDSSVALLLLKKQGHDVEAIFIKVWQPDFIECNWREEKRDAMRICAQLKVPFNFIDLEKEYKKEVVDYMIEGYRSGITPNPDIMCNKYIKFGHLFDYAKQRGFDYIATGHYAKTKEGRLYRGKDKNKDQSYFLWTLTKDKLTNILFPIGDLEKTEVRKIAEKNDLITSHKKDSQGVCILGPVDMKDFLKKYSDIKTGNVLDESGQIIGKHDSAILYTIGERHGFEIDKQYKGIDDKNLYVISKDMDKNTITVSKNNKSSVISKIKISDISFVSEKFEGQIYFQTRYRQKPQRGFLEDGILKSDFDEIPAIGQSVVFYKGDECIGGGIINEVI